MDDVALVAGVANGEEDAFAEVYKRHGEDLCGLAVRMLKAPQLAEDVVHEVLARLWEHPTGFDGNRGGLGPYLRVQVRSRCIDMIRAEVSRAAREGRGPQTGVCTAAPDAAIEQEETLGALREALAALRHEERAVIELAYLSGLKYAEVADMLGLPVGTVKSRIRRGLERLRRVPALIGPDAK